VVNEAVKKRNELMEKERFSEIEK
jgi:hypothetical protein